jgi:hypothetical protein
MMRATRHFVRYAHYAAVRRAGSSVSNGVGSSVWSGLSDVNRADWMMRRRSGPLRQYSIVEKRSTVEQTHV